MSFQKVKPTKPELTRITKKRDFSQRGENLLEIKREQLHQSLNEVTKKYFDRRDEVRAKLLENMKLLQETYKFIGKEKIERISNYNLTTSKPSVDITYVHKKGIDLPEIKLVPPQKYLPSYSFSDTALHIDILIKKMNDSLDYIVELGELDKKMYLISENHKKINRRIDALDDLIIPKLNRDIKTIEEILSDEEREEFIRLKKIKEMLEI